MNPILASRLTKPTPFATVGRFTYGNPTFKAHQSCPHMTIGNFCSIADSALFIMGGEHNTNSSTTYPFNFLFEVNLPWHEHSKGPITVGHDVWIGERATILSGVTIHTGAVIGAGSVVTYHVPPYAIVAGNPAQIIRFRFPSSEINRLLDEAWWDWPLEKIRLNAARLMNPLDRSAS